MLHALDYAILALYLLATLALGWWVGRGQATQREYVVGNRSLPAAAVGLSMLATVLNAETTSSASRPTPLRPT